VERVLIRLMQQAQAAGFKVEFVDHNLTAKRRAGEIRQRQDAWEREQSYRALVNLVDATINDALRALPDLDDPPDSLDIKAV
jgi:hypothetical protein